MKILENGSVTSPKGFNACGITAGLKQSGKPDMALIFSETPCVAAAAFTQNAFAAAPVNLGRATRNNPTHHGVIVNSGIANACTGDQGEIDAIKMIEMTAEAINGEFHAHQFFVSSTGRIGPFLPMEKIEQGIKLAATSLKSDGGLEAAQAIMTTDLVPKFIGVEIEIGGQTITIGGISKGSGMINPQMKGKYATMLAYLTTDAKIEKELLQYFLDMTLDESFNRITVDGDTSTNDTYLAFANGLADNTLLKFDDKESPDALKFFKALKYVAAELARKMVLDGEGVTRFVEITVKNAKSKSEAKTCAETIANSLLCKTAWFGGDPNWGRIIDAAGYSGIEINVEETKLYYNDLMVFAGGLDAGVPEEEQFNQINRPEFKITLDVHIGQANYTVWTGDLSYDYVKINAEYHT
jgi:glutamate N-acetyltransferase/amino-acid N-acetyltransferase